MDPPRHNLGQRVNQPDGRRCNSSPRPRTQSIGSVGPFSRAKLDHFWRAPKVRPQMRIGINTGLAVVTQIGGESANLTALGDTVNLASRLQTLAEPGTVLLSEATHRLVDGLVDMSFVGEHLVKGKADPQKTYRLDA